MICDSAYEGALAVRVAVALGVVRSHGPYARLTSEAAELARAFRARHAHLLPLVAVRSIVVEIAPFGGDHVDASALSDEHELRLG